MSDEGKPIQAEHIFKKVVWRHTISISHAMEQATTWSIAGIAAITGLFISNLDSVATIVSLYALRWFLILLTASIVSGAIAKHIGLALGKGLEMMEKLEGVLHSDQGKRLMGQMSIPPKELIKEIARPFFWPLSAYIKKGGFKGIEDYLHSDKIFVKMFCVQLIFIYLHWLTAAVGLFIIAFGIVMPNLSLQ